MDKINNPDMEWYSVRKRILTTFMAVLILAATPTVIVNDFKIFDPSTPIQKVIVYIVSNIGYLAGICIFLLRNRISLKSQYLAMIITNMIFGILGEYVYGNSGLTVLFFIIASLLTEFYFDDKWKFLTFGISLFSMIFIGTLFVRGLVLPTPDLDIKEGASYILLLRVLNYIFFASAILYFINKSKHYLFSTIEDLKGKYHALEKMHEELAAAEEELRCQYSALAEKESRIYDLAYYDPLTKFPNKLLFKETFNREIEKNKSRGRKLALVYIDLDNLKKINISKGHQTGDDMIVLVVENIKRYLGDNVMVARIGGDEFAILLRERDGTDTLDVKIRKIVDTIAMPHIIRGSSFQLGAASASPCIPMTGIISMNC